MKCQWYPILESGSAVVEDLISSIKAISRIRTVVFFLVFFIVLIVGFLLFFLLVFFDIFFVFFYQFSLNW